MQNAVEALQGIETLAKQATGFAKLAECLQNAANDARSIITEHGLTGGFDLGAIEPAAETPTPAPVTPTQTPPTNGRRTAKKKAARKTPKKATAKKKTAKKKRPQNDMPLPALILDILAKEQQGLKLDGLLEAVIARGYKTTSKKPNGLYQIVYQAVRTLMEKKEVKKDKATRQYKAA